MYVQLGEGASRSMSGRFSPFSFIHFLHFVVFAWYITPPLSPCTPQIILSRQLLQNILTYLYSSVLHCDLYSVCLL